MSLKLLRDAQQFILEIFSAEADDFALAGGTALELYYLHHRFSFDLDFFSRKYDESEINNLIAVFKKRARKKIIMEAEFIASSRARVRFYTMQIKGSNRPLKMDFAEEVIIPQPSIRKIGGVRVYAAEDLFLHKITAIAGVQSTIDEIGREISEGRKEARDVFDVYMLSKKIRPLHLFLQSLSPQLQRGMVHWYRTFSRQELKLALMDLNIYDPKFNAHELVIHIEDEIKQFVREVIDR